MTISCDKRPYYPCVPGNLCYGFFTAGLINIKDSVCPCAFWESVLQKDNVSMQSEKLSNL